MSLSDAVEVLHAADSDRLAALTLLPVPQRAAQIALFALAAELARVPRTSDEPMLAEIRLQWWVDALAGLPGSAGLHPLLAALAQIPDTPPPQALAQLAEGQRTACEGEPFTDLAEVLDWIDATHGALSWQAARLLRAKAGDEALIVQQGRALGVASCILRGAPREIPQALHAPLRAAGLQAARGAAAAGVPRAVAPVLVPSPDLRAALTGGAPPSEFARRRALLWFAVRRNWRF